MWTAPRTWVTSELVTSSQMNTHVRDNLKSLEHAIALEDDDLDVVNTTAETTLYSVTVPANELGANGSCFMDIWGDALGTAGGSHFVTVRLKFGGTTHLNWAVDYVNVTARVGVHMRSGVINQGATNAQLVVGQFSTTQAVAPVIAIPVPVAAAIDTTVDQTLLVSVQWASAQATNSIRRRWSRVLLGQN
jgi:hypothetical protein